MAEILTYVRRRRSRGKAGKHNGYEALATTEDDAEALDKENAMPVKVDSVGKGTRGKRAIVADGGGDRRTSWIGRMLSYSSSGVMTHEAAKEKKGGSRKKKSASKGAYSRRAMPSNAEEKKQKAYSQYLQDMKSYFCDVDAYELVEESPEPAKNAVLEANLGGDFSYSSRRASNRRSSVVIRRDSVQGYGARFSNGSVLRLSTKFDTLVEDVLEEGGDVQQETNDMGTIEERGEEGAEGLLDSLHGVMDNLKIDEEGGDLPDPGSDLGELLVECGQLTKGAGEGGIPSLDEFLARMTSPSACDASVRKVGEGTFGEAFKLNNNLVLKVVPIDGDLLVNGEKQKTSGELYAEVVIHNCLKRLRESGGTQNSCKTFIETHGISVCRGKYAACLLEAWEAWDEIHTSENDHVGTFLEDQLYIVFVYNDGGEDLESFRFRSFEEIRSMLMQVTMGLAVAEEELKFEHRDLHWGNILLKRMPRSASLSSRALRESNGNSLSPVDDSHKTRYVLRGVPIQVDTSGLQVQIIDFTLSRLEAKARDPGSGEANQTADDDFVAFCDLSLDEWLFKGPKGDIQAETYRKMLKNIEGDKGEGSWAEFHPRNNVFWLQYLVDCVLMNKMRANSGEDAAVDMIELTSDQSRQLRNFRKACMNHQSVKSCHDLVWHDLFKDLWRLSKKE
ncbi:hypothetical protein A3770_12p66050 [Chloropicon primus]|uniref:non-specific serine/threonine protein kinase n=3 Tax=Chloropicon primus TaxID=1764295 RepID=A0A5B8MUQ7_9CHLO|nr:hypothetical protein A3770_12p66050 [Chloropicon primus]|eukprot:QDZ24087.1 hypothetical protein A3770_12p66050 [Chloropicon primus]